MEQHRPLPLLVLEAQTHPCGYLPGRSARHEYLISDDVTSWQYQELMDQRFRRSGRWIYRTACGGCRECVPIRVDVGRFAASRSQRRALRKNADLSVDVARPIMSDEKWELYRRYQAGQHGEHAEEDRRTFEDFLYSSPIETLEMTYRVKERLVGAGIIDACPDALSSVYFYFDPAEARRSLGVFSALCEIDECQRLGKKWWYVGYYVRDSQKMNYKAHFRPYELLTDGHWQEPP